MATFIDDQGGTGWTPGSHTHFRLAAAYLPTANVGTFKEGVKNLRAELGRAENYEFKFSRTHGKPQWRTKFYQLAMNLGLRFTVCAFNKKKIRPGSVSSTGFHQGCAVSLAVYLRATYLEAEAAWSAQNGGPVLLCEPILVDDNKDPAMLAEIEAAFRGLRSGQNPEWILTNKPKFRNSEIDATLQLADMVMGAVGEHLDGVGSQWYNFIHGGGRDLGVVELSSCVGVDDLSG